ncbi:MAG: heparinase II/III family protein, partial [Candidatus Latescibacterota bacterium]|nr:heparinase II/III family protein [Candidatus Latescibacterota bacterium]
MPEPRQDRKILTGLHDPATLRHKVKQHRWASAIYAEILESVRPYVERHANDPVWIVSRLCMHWQTRNSRTFVNGARWSHSEGKASVPTVRFAGARDWATDYASPAIEDLLPYSEDTRGIWLQNKAKPGNPWEWADVNVTGHVIEGINERIMGLAEKAAFLYWYLDDDDYAKFAADILITYCQGMHHRHPPETFEDHSQAHILGLATFEVIHERITTPLAVAYEFLVPYLHQTGIDTELIQSLFRRWANRIIEGGFAHGNWNLHQAKYIVPLGLVLKSNEAYEDNRGWEYYVSHFISESTSNQACLADLVEQYDKKGVWPESPGYAFNVTDAIIHISQMVFNGIGQDPVANYPVLEQAALLVYQFCFPNGRTVGYGDTNHNLPNTDTLELMIARARRLGESRTEERLTAVLQTQIDDRGYQRGQNGSIFELATYVSSLLPSKTLDGALSTRTFLAETVSLVLQRNGYDPHTGLMASLTATRGGHSHAGSLALELYGCGLTISPDSGSGVSYWQKEHSEYYARPPAHNTVVVDGISTYDPHNHDHPFTINSVEPKPQSQFALSDDNSFFDVSFHEPSTDSDQRRIVSLIRTSATSGYYVDIFRSRRRDGADRYHDYI